MKKLLLFPLSICMLLLAACTDNGDGNDGDVNVTVSEPAVEHVDYSVEYVERLSQTRTLPSQFDLGSYHEGLVNSEALVPSMCYTKHDGTYNPCYICHQDWIRDDDRANMMNDGFLQNEYRFSDYAHTNHWTNLFLDRSAETAQISDETIDSYVNSDNYSALAPMLKAKGFIGFVPDLQNYQLGAEAFDAEGFAKDGSNWIAFNYKPLPSTFWPVNGSTDDVLIRLPKAFRETSDGLYSRDVYRFNLAIVEAAVKGLESITVDALDETAAGVDLNGDGNLGIVDEIQRPDHYVGNASYLPVETYLYPRYTEFMHSVRYVGTDASGAIYNPPHMKELRYMVKVKSYADENSPMTKERLAAIYEDEWQEKYEGNNPPFFASLGEKGLDDGMGWWLQGFIEDADGALRPQTYEETFFCMGCHTNLGSTFDQVFSFARKVDGAKGWGYIDLKAMTDAPNRGETEGEILTYFKRVGGGSEFRAENDIQHNYFDNGEVNETKVKTAASVYELITPSRASALEMNKAYRVLVKSQDFVHGRDGNGKPVVNVHQEVTEETPRLPEAKKFSWDMRLNWTKQ
jgi:hypothetical protein